MADRRTSTRNILTRSLAVVAMLFMYGFSFIGGSAVLVGATATSAQARGFGRGGGGFRGGGFRGGGFGLGYGYGYGGYYPYYGDAGVCYVVRRRVMTPYGWRVRRVSVCE